MKIQKKISKDVEVTVIDDVFCNLCSKSLKKTHHNPDASTEDWSHFEGLVEEEVQGGYAAHLGDMTKYSFSLCEDCLVSELDGGVISPEVSSPSNATERWLTKEQSDKRQAEQQYYKEVALIDEKRSELMKKAFDPSISKEEQMKAAVEHDRLMIKAQDLYLALVGDFLSPEEKASQKNYIENEKKQYQLDNGVAYED